MRSSRRVLSVALLVCACALAALAHSSVSATELLRAVRPSIMRAEFNYQSELGRIYSEPVHNKTKKQRGWRREAGEQGQLCSVLRCALGGRIRPLILCGSH